MSRPRRTLRTAGTPGPRSLTTRIASCPFQLDVDADGAGRVLDDVCHQLADDELGRVEIRLHFVRLQRQKLPDRGSSPGRFSCVSGDERPLSCVQRGTLLPARERACTGRIPYDTLQQTRSVRNPTKPRRLEWAWRLAHSVASPPFYASRRPRLRNLPRPVRGLCLRRRCGPGSPLRELVGQPRVHRGFADCVALALRRR